MSQEIVLEEEVIDDEDEIVPFEPEPFGFRWTHIGWNNPLRRPGDALWPLALRIKKVVFIILLQPLWLLELAYRRLEAFASNLRVNKGRRRKLLMWVQHTAGLETTPSLASVWHDGFVLCAVVRSAVPGACTSPFEPRIHRTVAHAQELALKYLGVPAAFCDEETCQILSPAMERRLTAYLQSVQRASSRLRLDPDNPALAVAPSSDEETSKNKISVVVRGMGIVQAVRGRKAVFYIYLLRKGVSLDAQTCPSDSTDPDFGDIEIRIQGPQNDFGLALIPSSSYLPVNDRTTTSSERRRLRFSLAPWFSTSRCANVPINFKLVEGSNRAVCVSYTPQSAGNYDLSILWRSIHVAGSPYSVMVDENDGRQTPTTPEKGCSRRRRRSKVVLRVVDFVDEKMLLTDDGRLTAITPANLTLLRRSLSETRERVPFLLCKIMPETTSTDSNASDGFMQSPHRIRRHRFVEKKRASHSHSLDESQNEKARERYRRLVGLCTLILRHTPKHKGLKILSAAEQILNGRPVRISEATDLLVQNVMKTLQPESEVISEAISENDTFNMTSVENDRQCPEAGDSVASRENETMVKLDAEQHTSPKKPTLENFVCGDSQPSDSDYSTPESELPAITYDTLSNHTEFETSEGQYPLSSENLLIENTNHCVDMNDSPSREINSGLTFNEETSTTIIEMPNKTNLCVEQSNSNQTTANSELLDFSLQISEDGEHKAENKSLEIKFCPENTSLRKTPNEEYISFKTIITAENLEQSHYDKHCVSNSKNDETDKKHTNGNVTFMPDYETDREFNLISDLVSHSDSIENEFNAISEDLIFSEFTEVHEVGSTDIRKEKEFTLEQGPGCAVDIEASESFNVNHQDEIPTKETHESQLDIFEDTQQGSNISQEDKLEDNHKNSNASELDKFELIKEESNLLLPEVPENLQDDSQSGDFKNSQTDAFKDSKGGNKTQSEVLDVSQDNVEESLPQRELFEKRQQIETPTQSAGFEECQQESNLLQNVLLDNHEKINDSQEELFEDSEEILHLPPPVLFEDGPQEEMNYSQAELFEDSQEFLNLPPPVLFDDGQQEMNLTQPEILENLHQNSNMLELKIQAGNKIVEMDIYDDSQEDQKGPQQDVFQDSVELVNITQPRVFEINRPDVNQTLADLIETSLHDTDKTIDDIFGIISMESQGSESDNTSNVILNEPNNCNVIVSEIYHEEPSSKVSDSFILTEINFDDNNESQCGTNSKTTEFPTQIVDLQSVNCENIVDIETGPALGETDYPGEGICSITNETSNIVNVDDLLLLESGELDNTLAFGGPFDTQVDMPQFNSDKQNISLISTENEQVCEIGSEANEIIETENNSSVSATCNLSEEAPAVSVSLNLDDFLVDHNTAYMETKFADTELQQFRLWPSDVVFGASPDESNNIDDSMVDFESVIAAPNLEEAMRQLEEGLQKAQQVATENVSSNTPSPNVSPVNYNSDRTTDDDDRTSNSACDDGMQQQRGENDTIDSDYVSMDDNQNSLQRSPESQNTDSPNGIEQWKQNRTFDDDNFTKDSYMGPAEREIWGLRDEDSDDESEDVNKRALRYYGRVHTPKDIQMDSISEETEETSEVVITNNSNQEINASGYEKKSENTSLDLVEIKDETKKNSNQNILIAEGNVETNNLNTNDKKSYRGDQVEGSVKTDDATEDINTNVSVKDAVSAIERTPNKELKEMGRSLSIPIIVIEDVDMVGIFKTFPPQIDGDIFSSKENSSSETSDETVDTSAKGVSYNETRTNKYTSMRKDGSNDRSVKIRTWANIHDVPSSESEVEKSSLEDQTVEVLGINASTVKPHSITNVNFTKSEVSLKENDSLVNVSTDGKSSPPPLSLKLKQLSECFQQQECTSTQKEEVVPSSQKVSNLKQYWDVNVNYQKRSDSPVGNEKSVRKIPLRRLEIASNSLASTKSKKRRSPSIRIPGIVSKWKKIFEQSQFKVSKSPNTTGYESVSIRSNRIMQWRKYWDSIGDESHQIEKNSSVRSHSVMETRPSKLVDHPKRSYTPEATWSKNHSLSELLGLDDSEILRDSKNPRSFLRKPLKKSLFIKNKEDTNTKLPEMGKECSATTQNTVIRNTEETEQSHPKELITDDIVLKCSTEVEIKSSGSITFSTNIDDKEITDSQFVKCTSNDISNGTEKSTNDSDFSVGQICDSDNKISDNDFTDTTKCAASNMTTIVNKTGNNDNVKEYSINLEQRIAIFKNPEITEVVEDRQDKLNTNLAKKVRSDGTFSPITQPSKVEDCQVKLNTNLARKVRSDGTFSPTTESSKVTDIPENTVKVGEMSVIFEGKQQQESSIWPKTIVNKEEKVSVNKLASIFAEKQQEPSLYRATRVRVSDEGITSSRFATPENQSTKDVLADLSRDFSDDSEPQPSISCSSPTPPESSSRHTILDTRQGSCSPSLPSTGNPNPDVECKTRFNRAKTFFQSLERNTPPPKASATRGNAWFDTSESKGVEALHKRKTKTGNKIHSAPTSDTESLSRISSGRLFLTSRGPGGSERAPKVSERFHVKDLFRDVVGSERTETTAGLRGIPHQQAVLAALRAVGEDSRPVSPYEELRSSPEPEEEVSRSPVPCEFQQEYPYLPNTPANLYKPRAALLTPTLIRRSELLRSE